jgi:hypothetical protein
MGAQTRDIHFIPQIICQANYLSDKTTHEKNEIGRGREIRTPDILLPKQARYQTALYPDQTSEKHVSVCS